MNSFTYTLDSLGRRVARQDSDSSQTQWKYDFYDQLTNAVRSGSPNGAADAAYQFGYVYDEVGNRLHEDRGQLDLEGMFNNLNQLTHLRWDGKLDVVGNVTSTNGPVTVKVAGSLATLYNTTNYLGGSRVKPGTNNISVVAYDASSNRTESVTKATMPPQNPQIFFWDLNGNLTNDGQRAFFWDEENRLVAIESLAGVPGVERRRSEYVYDAASRRSSTKDYVWNSATNNWQLTTDRRFIWDGWLLLAEADASGATTAYHVHGLDLSQSLQGAGGIGGLVARIETGTNYLYTFDGNGNVTDVLREDGTAAAHYEYDPFGRTIAQSGSYAASNPWRFSTKQIESWWNLYYYGHRFYSPGLHTWISRDPIDEIGSPMWLHDSGDFNDALAILETSRRLKTEESRRLLVYVSRFVKGDQKRLDVMLRYPLINDIRAFPPSQDVINVIDEILRGRPVTHVNSLNLYAAFLTNPLMWIDALGGPASYGNPECSDQSGVCLSANGCVGQLGNLLTSTCPNGCKAGSCQCDPSINIIWGGGLGGWRCCCGCK